MQALILAGGQGTRLLPLTVTMPKPVLPLAGRPFLSFMLDWLARHGVDEAILSCGFLADDVARVLGDRHGNVRLRYVNEQDPLGTAGPLRLAFDEGGLDERLLVLNGDVLTDLDLGAQLDFHRRAGALATLALVAVEDTTAYGLVPTGPGGEVEAFLEKFDAGGSAAVAPTARVNAGAYVLERSVAELIAPGRAVSFEREVFPSLLGKGLFGHPAEGYWIDIGTPERYLEATYDLLTGAVESSLRPRDATGSLIYPGCRTRGADVGPLSVLGESCVVEPGARVARSALHGGVTVGPRAAVDGAVLGAGVSVGEGARVEPGAVVGAGASIAPGARVEAGARVEPGAVVAIADTPPAADPRPGPGHREQRGAATVTAPGVEDFLDRAAVAAVDSARLLGDVEAQPHQLEDALWRVESAGIATGERPGGLLVCGMGGSAIGGDLAAAAVGRRALAQLQTVRGYGLPPGARADSLALCASYSGETEETLACFTEAGAAGIERAVITTGGRLAAAARAEGVPVIGVPAGMRPRAAVAYMLVGALECAALCEAAPSLRTEVEAASALLARLVVDWGPDACDDALPKRLARDLHGRVPVIYGVGAAAPAAYRWKTQINENAELMAFSAALPEADHNELSGWKGAAEIAPFAAVFLDDAGADARVRRHVELTVAEIAGLSSTLAQVPSFGETALERVTAAVLLGDFTSVYLAVLRRVDPAPVEAIERLKQSVRRDSGAAGAQTK